MKRVRNASAAAIAAALEVVIALTEALLEELVVGAAAGGFTVHAPITHARHMATIACTRLIR